MTKVLFGASGNSVAPRATLRFFCSALGLMLAFTLAPQRVVADKGIRAAPAPLPASAFYRLPQYVSPQLSPSGRYMASRVVVENKLGLLVNALEGED